MNKIHDYITDYINSQSFLLEYLPSPEIKKLIDRLEIALDKDQQIFVFGNGGSASNASHFATDLGKGASDKMNKRFRVMALTDNVSMMTAIANDYDYSKIFERQLMNLAKRGDVVIGLSVSGNSQNCVNALIFAKMSGLYSVALTGASRASNSMATLADLPIIVNSRHFGMVEDAHMTIGHIVANYFMDKQ